MVPQFHCFRLRFHDAECCQSIPFRILARQRTSDGVTRQFIVENLMIYHSQLCHQILNVRQDTKHITVDMSLNDIPQCSLRQKLLLRLLLRSTRERYERSELLACSVCLACKTMSIDCSLTCAKHVYRRLMMTEIGQLRETPWCVCLNRVIPRKSRRSLGMAPPREKVPRTGDPSETCDSIPEYSIP